MKEKYCIHIPLNLQFHPKNKSGMDCWVLILMNCVWEHRITNIEISKEDRKFLNLNRLSYLRGIKELELLGWIKVKRKPGKNLIIFIRKVPQTEGIIEYVLANEKERQKILEIWNKI